jgi:8-amino-7-oxononanoate synthase
LSSLNAFASSKIAALEDQRLLRRLIETDRSDGVWAVRGGRRLLSFSCNDYLNLSQHPALKAAAVAAIGRYGVGAGASRLITGNHPLYGELERRLARLKGTEAACVFGSGYLANVGVIPTLVGSADVILVDELAHSCIRTGAELSKAATLFFRHNDADHVAALLAEHRSNHRYAMIATDGVFSMDGDLAPLGLLGALADRYDAWLLSDDAHGVGVVGGGRGSAFADAGATVPPLQMGTLSKAIGGYGGYLCASAPVIDLIKTRARSLVYTTGLPPASVAAAIAALDLIAQQPDYAALPLAKARAFTRMMGFPEAASPIVPIVIGDAVKALVAAQLLENEGFLVVPIRPPTVPPGTARLRLAFTALHPDAEIARLAQTIRTRILA